MERRKKDIKLLIYIFLYMKIYWIYILTIAICIFILTFTNYLQPLIIKKIMDDGMICQNETVLLINVLILFSIIFTGQIVEFIHTIAVSNFYNSFTTNIYEIAFSKLLKLKYHYFKEKNTSEIINQLQTDIKNIGSITDNSFFTLIKFFFTVISGITGLLDISFKLTFLILALLPIKYLLVKYVSNKERKIVKMQMTSDDKFVRWLGDTINGILEIKLWNLYKLKINEFREKQHSIISHNKKKTFIQSCNVFVDMMLVWFVNCMIYFVGGIFVIDGSLTPGEIIAFITYSTYVINPFMALLNFNMIIANVIPSIERFKKFMDLETEQCNLNSAMPLPDTPIIELKDITFCYSEKVIFNKINMQIKYGEKIAIIGDNGSGKSTLINLILRLFSPTTGKILLNNVDIDQYDIKEYRNMFSVVLQNNYIFSDSIKNNIDLFGKCDNKAMQKTIKLSGLKFYEDTKNSIRINGSKLSGGECQRIALARALIKDSKIIIFDEITSNQNISFDSYLSNIIEKEFAEKTVIMVTHKKTHLHLMNRIFRIEDQDIKEMKDVV